MDFSRGETVEWSVEDKSLLALQRLHPPAPILKKTLRVSSPPSSSSGKNAAPPSPSSAPPNAPKPSR
jgi:hypothetical protein